MVKKSFIILFILVSVIGFTGCAINSDVQSSASPTTTPIMTGSPEAPQTPSSSASSTIQSTSPTPEDLIPVIDPHITNLVNPQKTGNIEEYKTYTNAEIEKTKSDKYKEISEPLLADLKYWLTQLNNENTPKNFAFAGLYSRICESYFIFPLKSDAYWGSVNLPSITLPGTAMSSAITPDYVKVVAIAQPLGEKYQDYYDVMNEIRGRNDEVEFLKGLNDIAGSDGYFAVDIYVNDMLELDRKLSLAGIKLYETTAMDMEQRHDNLNQMSDDPNLKEYLKKYNREINFSDELKGREWNLFLFKKREMLPCMISIALKTYGGGPILY